MKEKTGRKKTNYALQHVRADSWCLMDETHLECFMTEGLYDTETSPLICRTNQWTDFYRTGTSVIKELMRCYLHLFIEIYSLITTK